MCDSPKFPNSPLTFVALHKQRNAPARRPLRVIAANSATMQSSVILQKGAILLTYPQIARYVRGGYLGD
jgi:hypothetical protein